MLSLAVSLVGLLLVPSSLVDWAASVFGLSMLALELVLLGVAGIAIVFAVVLAVFKYREPWRVGLKPMPPVWAWLAGGGVTLIAGVRLFLSPAMPLLPEGMFLLSLIAYLASRSANSRRSWVGLNLASAVLVVLILPICDLSTELMGHAHAVRRHVDSLGVERLQSWSAAELERHAPYVGRDSDVALDLSVLPRDIADFPGLWDVVLEGADGERPQHVAIYTGRSRDDQLVVRIWPSGYAPSDESESAMQRYADGIWLHR